MRKLRYFLGGRLFPCALTTVLIALSGAFLSFYLPRAFGALAAGERLFSLIAALAVAGSDALPESKTGKLVLILLLPWTGALFSLIWRNKAAQNLPKDVPARAIHCDGKIGAYAALSERFCGMEAGFAQSAEYFSGGERMRAALLKDLSEAERFIWLDYYIVERGAFWNGILDILEEKARAGADVRLIYDDFGCCLTLPKDYARELSSRGVKCFPYHPVRLFPDASLNRRDHRKIAVIDGVTAYTGGINLADEYVGEKIRFGHWKDSAVRLTGEPAKQLARLFARTWAERLPQDDELLQSMVSALPASEGSIPCAPFCDSGKSENGRTGARVYRRLFSSAARRIYVFTPYLALDRTLLGALASAAGAGADVRVMIPHIPDKKAVFLLTRSYARELLVRGVKVREYTDGFLHAKNCVCDGLYTVISSYNLDYRSMYLQAECGVLLADEAFAEQAEADFLAAWEAGTPVKQATAAEKLLSPFFRLFAPLA